MTVAEYNINLIVIDGKRVFTKDDMHELSKRDAEYALRLVGVNKKPIELDTTLNDYEVSMLNVFGEGDNAQLTVPGISTKLSISPSTAAGRLYKLERFGLVDRSRSKHGPNHPDLWWITEEGSKVRSDD